MNKGEFINVLEAFQQKFTNIEIIVENKHYKTDKNTGQLQGTPYYANTRLVMESPGGKFRYEDESALEWIGDDGKMKKEAALGLSERVFDGRIGIFGPRYGFGPKKGRPEYYEISLERCAENDLKNIVSGADLELFAAYYNDEGLAQFLRKCDNWELVEDGSGGYLVRYVLNNFPHDQRIREVAVDLNRGGAITGIRHFWKSNGEVTKEYRVTLKDCGNGIWLPESADVEFYEYHEIYKLRFTKAAMNQALPEDIFTLTLQPGVRVLDSTIGMDYVIGHEDDDALLKSVEEGLAEVEGKSAEGSTVAPEPAQGGSSVKEKEKGRGDNNRWLVAGIVFLVAIVVVLVVLIFLRKGPRQATGTAILIGVLAAASGAAFASASAAQAGGSGYERDYFGLRVPVFQCGLFCTLAQLRHFDRTVDVGTIKEHLGCTLDGTDLFAVKAVLEAYGLDVRAVKNLTLAALIDHLNAGGSTILAIREENRPGHFFSVLGWRDGRFEYLDFPTKQRTIDKETMEEGLTAWGGVALLVSDTPQKASEGGQIQVVPSTVDLGEIQDGKEKPKTQFTVTNASKRVAVIAGFRAACGCMDVEASSKWLEPGTSSTVNCTIRPAAWGAADKKTVYVNFGDGGTVPVAIKARLAQVASEASVSAEPRAIYVSDDLFGLKHELSRTVRLTLPESRKASITWFSSTESWVKVATRTEGPPGKANEGELLLTVERIDGYGVSEALVRVCLEGISDPVTITVRQDRPYPFEVLPKVLHFVAGAESEKAVEIRPTDASVPFEIGSVTGVEGILSVTPPGGLVSGAARLVFHVDGYKAKRWSAAKGVVHIRQGGVVVDLPITVLLQNDDVPEQQSQASHAG